MIPHGTTSIDDVLRSPQQEEASSVPNGHSAVDALQQLAKTVIYDALATAPTPLPDHAVSPNPVQPATANAVGDEVEDSEIGEKHNPILHVFGMKIDRDSLVVMGTLIGIWWLIWRTSGLGKALNADLTFTAIFWLLILYMLLSIKTSDTTSGGVVYELNILLTVEQMISILFGTVVLFALFGSNLPVHENCRHVISQLSLSIIVILTLASMWINVYTSGRTFRAIRKFKQGIYNIALALFLIIGLIFIKGGGKACQGGAP